MHQRCQNPARSPPEAVKGYQESLDTKLIVNKWRAVKTLSNGGMIMIERHDIKGSATEFVPSEKQLSLLMAVYLASYGGGIRAWCRAAGIHHGSYYRWVKSRDFRRWWIDQQEQYFINALPQVCGALLHAATEMRAPGEPKVNLAAIRLFFKRFDKDYFSKTRRKQHITADFKFSEMTDAELARAIKATNIDEYFEANPTGYRAS